MIKRIKQFYSDHKEGVDLGLVITGIVSTAAGFVSLAYMAMDGKNIDGVSYHVGKDEVEHINVHLKNGYVKPFHKNPIKEVEA